MGDRKAEEARNFLREHAHYEEDIATWRGAAQAVGGPVADLGAAAGRVTLPLARDGHEVWAVDRSPAMLAEITRQADAEPAAVGARVHTVEADMCDFRLPEPCGLVLIAMNTLQVLVDVEDHLRCLACARRALRPDGELWFDLTLPDLGDIAGSLGLVRALGFHREPDGRLLVHSGWYDDLDVLDQSVTLTLRVEERPPEGGVDVRLREHRVHLFQPIEVEHLLARSGFAPVEVWGDHEGSPLAPDSDRQVWRCRPI
jgi:SAM-dependent methyltransferase